MRLCNTLPIISLQIFNDQARRYQETFNAALSQTSTSPQSLSLNSSSKVVLFYIAPIVVFKQFFESCACKVVIDFSFVHAVVEGRFDE